MARDSWRVHRGRRGTPDQKDSAELAARQLRELGVDENLIIVLPVPNMPLHHVTRAEQGTIRAQSSVHSEGLGTVRADSGRWGAPGETARGSRNRG